MTESSAIAIGLIVDIEYGERLSALAHEMPIWVISSVTNDPAIEVARKAVGSNSITKLMIRIGEDDKDFLHRAINAIDEHHGEASGSDAQYRSLLIYGATCAPSRELVSNLGFKSMLPMSYGFRMEK
jgi:hypothetical protein